MRRLKLFITAIMVFLFISNTYSQQITYGSGYSGPICGEEGKGAYYTGEYRNLFVDVLGKTEADVQTKIDKIWKHFFTPGSSSAVYFEVGDDMAYILDVGNNDVRTEGQSYGMMITVQLDHKTEFDKLWRWAKKYMQHQSGIWEGYFAWQCKPDGTKIDSGCAPDGEEYFITALLLASNRWGNDGEIDYNAEAQNILKNIRNKTGVGGVHNMYNSENHMVVFSPLYENVKFSDPSYCLPGFMELWARWAETDNEFWAEAATAARTLLKNSCHETSGLFPEYSLFDGTPYCPDWQSYDTKQYKFDAIRCAMNIGMDFNWFCADSANQAEMMTRLLTFFKNDKYKHGCFHWNGEIADANFDYNAGIAGTNGVGCFAITDNELAKEVLNKLWKTAPPTGQWRYYNGMVYFLAMLNVSGNYRIYKPLTGLEVIDTTVYDTYNGVTYDKSTTFSYNQDCKIYRVHVIVETTGLNDVKSSGTVLYPNPATEKATISSTKNISFVEIRNCEGKLLATTTSHEINVAGYEKGLYVVTINFSDDSQEVMKLAVN